MDNNIKIHTAEQFKKVINDNEGRRIELFTDDGKRIAGYCSQSYQNSTYFVLRRKGNAKGKMYPYCHFSNDNLTPSYTKIKIQQIKLKTHGCPFLKNKKIKL